MATISANAALTASSVLAAAPIGVVERKTSSSSGSGSAATLLFTKTPSPDDVVVVVATIRGGGGRIASITGMGASWSRSATHYTPASGGLGTSVTEGTLDIWVGTGATATGSVVVTPDSGVSTYSFVASGYIVTSTSKAVSPSAVIVDYDYGNVRSGTSSTAGPSSTPGAGQVIIDVGAAGDIGTITFPSSSTPSTGWTNGAIGLAGAYARSFDSYRIADGSTHQQYLGHSNADAWVIISQITVGGPHQATVAMASSSTLSMTPRASQLVATASGQYASYGPANAVDANATTYWESSGDANSWLRVNGNGAQPLTISAYSLLCDGVNPVGAWAFEGSNDGSAWTTLDTQTGVTWAWEGETKTFPLGAQATYVYYRVKAATSAYWKVYELGLTLVYSAVAMSSSVSTTAATGYFGYLSGASLTSTSFLWAIDSAAPQVIERKAATLSSGGTASLTFSTTPSSSSVVIVVGSMRGAGSRLTSVSGLGATWARRDVYYSDVAGLGTGTSISTVAVDVWVGTGASTSGTVSVVSSVATGVTAYHVANVPSGYVGVNATVVRDNGEPPNLMAAGPNALLTPQQVCIDVAAFYTNGPTVYPYDSAPAGGWINTYLGTIASYTKVWDGYRSAGSDVSHQQTVRIGSNDTPGVIAQIVVGGAAPSPGVIERRTHYPTATQAAATLSFVCTPSAGDMVVVAATHRGSSGRIASVTGMGATWARHAVYYTDTGVSTANNSAAIDIWIGTGATSSGTVTVTPNAASVYMGATGYLVHGVSALAASSAVVVNQASINTSLAPIAGPSAAVSPGQVVIDNFAVLDQYLARVVVPSSSTPATGWVSAYPGASSSARAYDSYRVVDAPNTYQQYLTTDDANSYAILSQLVLGGDAPPSANLSGASVLAAAGTVERNGATALTASSALTSAGVISRIGSDALTATSILSVAGTVTRAGAAAMSSTSTMTVTGAVGTAPIDGAAALSATSALTSAATAFHVLAADAAMSSTASLGATALRTAVVAAALASATALNTGTPYQELTGVISLVATQVLTALATLKTKQSFSPFNTSVQVIPVPARYVSVEQQSARFVTVEQTAYVIGVEQVARTHVTGIQMT